MNINKIADVHKAFEVVVSHELGARLSLAGLRRKTSGEEVNHDGIQVPES